MKRKYSDLENDQVLEGARNMVVRERETISDFLEHLYEVDIRKLHLEMAYPNLFEFCVRELGLTKSQSYERARAVGAMKSVPKVRELVHAGTISPSNAALLKRAIDLEEQTTGEKTSNDFKDILVEAAVGSSKRQFQSSLEKMLTTPIAKAALKEKIFYRTSTRSGVQFEIDVETEAKIRRARELVSVVDLGSLFDRALEALIEKEEKRRKYIVVAGNDGDQGSGPGNNGSSSSQPAGAAENKFPPTTDDVRKVPLYGDRVVSAQQPAQQRRRISQFNPFSRIIPAAFKASIALKSGARCEYVDPASKRRCSSTSHLQIDHRKPLALGGKTELSNLRHLCAAHNRFVAMNAGLSIPPEAFKTQ